MTDITFAQQNQRHHTIEGTDEWQQECRAIRDELSDGPLTAAEIKRYCHLGDKQANNRLRAMRERNVIEQIPHPDDGRKVAYRLVAPPSSSDD